MPTPNTRGSSLRYSVTLPPAIAKALTRRCAAKGETPSEVVRLALIDYLALPVEAAAMGTRGPKPRKRKEKRES